MYVCLCARQTAEGAVGAVEGLRPHVPTAYTHGAFGPLALLGRRFTPFLKVTLTWPISRPVPLETGCWGARAGTIYHSSTPTKLTSHHTRPQGDGTSGLGFGQQPENGYTQI